METLRRDVDGFDGSGKPLRQSPRLPEGMEENQLERLIPLGDASRGHTRVPSSPSSSLL